MEAVISLAVREIIYTSFLMTVIDIIPLDVEKKICFAGMLCQYLQILLWFSLSEMTVISGVMKN